MSLGSGIGISKPSRLSGVFSPSDLSGLKFWGKADAGINGGSPTDLDAVSLWSDQSGLGNDATQGTGVSQPIWHSSGFGSNSMPYLDFDGSNDQLLFGDVISKLPNHTVVIAFRFESASTLALLVEASAAGQ